MPYATQAQIELAAGGPARLREIADWDENGTVDPDVIAWAQMTADALIDGHARLRFAALLDAAGTSVDTAQMLAANEAVYQLRHARGQASQADVDAASARLLIYQAIAEGSFRPAEPLPTKSTAIQSAWVAFNDDDSTGDGCPSRKRGPF